MYGRNGWKADIEPRLSACRRVRAMTVHYDSNAIARAGRGMDVAGYILALLAIISGLAIADMIVSLHGVLANRSHVKWDWLALVAAACIFMLIVASWGGSYRAYKDLPEGPWFWEFILVLCQNIALYLAARASLPDDVSIGQDVDLAAHYAFISRYLWASVSVTFGLVVIFGIIFGGIERLSAHWEVIVGLVLIISLVIWTDRRFHRLVVPALFALLSVAVLPTRLLGG